MSAHHSRPPLKIPAVANLMEGIPSAPPSATFPYDTPPTPGLPRSASAVETNHAVQVQSINENIQEDHTRQMTPPHIHPSHSTSHMVRQQYTPGPQTPTPQPLTFPQQPPLHSYMPIPVSTFLSCWVLKLKIL